MTYEKKIPSKSCLYGREVLKTVLYHIRVYIGSCVYWLLQTCVVCLHVWESHFSESKVSQD